MSTLTIFVVGALAHSSDEEMAIAWTSQTASTGWLGVAYSEAADHVVHSVGERDV